MQMQICTVKYYLLRERKMVRYMMSDHTLNNSRNSNTRIWVNKIPNKLKRGSYLKCNLGCPFSSKEDYSCTILILKKIV